ncbi:piggyBac transposable element-derived protein 3-like [Nilaparvata lugens]|uniref:piggyBac transposable element-derived protein 3-like n=1 Tax=Nilaparvata lugens TaxID=108931 RepID=UPI00193E9849|nr:piggyBac transposable element-derived protein 3-like [Nilaparvata lugens]
MTRDRYFQFRAAIHVVNNNDVTAEAKAHDKLWKVRPIIDRFQSTVLKIPREAEASIDEQMIPFTGHVAFRQFVPRKPNPTGLKNYVLSSKQGLILDFEVYQGKNTTRLVPEVEGPLKLGTGGQAVLRLAETCPPGTHLYFDRFFTGIALLDALKLKGISGTGTAMKQRFPNTNLKSDAELTAEGRGACDVVVRDDESVLLLKWVDNKTITMASTAHGKAPLSLAKRYSRAEKQYVDVQMPSIVKQYNTNMGGVDLHNRMIAHYRSYHRTKKWTVRFFEHFCDMACVNSWLTYREDCMKAAVPKNSIMDLHFFKMRMAQLLIQDKNEPIFDSETDSDGEPRAKRKAGRPGNVSLPLPEKRSQGALHLPQV